MDEKIDCRIVIDLLPSYMDGLLSDYSKQIVVEHIEKCKECKEVFETMGSDISMVQIEENNIETKKIKSFLKKTKIRNIMIGIILASIIFSIAGVSTWGWYKSEYLAATVVVPVEHIEVLEVRDNNDGTVYVKLATNTDFKVTKWKYFEDENDSENFILQAYYPKKIDVMTAQEKSYYEGYSFIIESTIIVDTEYHEFNNLTGTIPMSKGTEPQNEIAKNKIIYRGLGVDETIVIWED
jgi:hypothetical protein